MGIRPPTIGKVHIVDAIDALAALGLARRRLLAAAGLHGDGLDDLDARLPSRAIVHLFAEAERITGDPYVGLHAAERAEPRGPLDYLLIASMTLADGLRHAERLSRIIIDTLRIRMEIAGDRASTIFDPGDAAFEASRHAIEYLIMASCRSIRRATGRRERLLEVHVRYIEVRRRAELERAFGCPVYFGRDDHRVVYPAADLRIASPFANPRIAEQIEKFVAALMARTSAPSTLRDRVADVARELLAVGRRAEARLVGRRLGMSERSLQRGLQQEGATFRDVRDGAVREVLEALLTNPQLKFEAVALGVGFNDAAALAKAVRRWAGCSLAQYRQRLLGGRAAVSDRTAPRSARAPRARRASPSRMPARA